MATESGSEASSGEYVEPWGKRVSFRAMLAGGNKLVLVDPPSGVSTYFKNRVFRSHGCTYDDTTCTFFATSPGTRGKDDGKVMALKGNCIGDPLLVTEGLCEPAAIGVYEPGRSVCVVTNKGIVVLEREEDERGDLTDTFKTRQISYRGYHRGISATAGGGIVSFCKGKVYMYDGSVEDGVERVLAETNYDMIINNALFSDNPGRRAQRSNCCFMDIVGDQLVMSDLQKHVISLWQVQDAAPHRDAEINYVGAIDVAITFNPHAMGLRGPHIPNGKMAFASGIRLDSEGWVICADADGRTIQVFNDRLQFVTRIEARKDQLPYISGLYVDFGGHLMVCDRKNEMGGLRVYMMEPREDTSKPEEPPAAPLYTHPRVEFPLPDPYPSYAAYPAAAAAGYPQYGAYPAADPQYASSYPPSAAYSPYAPPTAHPGAGDYQYFQR